MSAPVPSPARRRLQRWTVLGLALALFVGGWILWPVSQLSEVERRLIGEWAAVEPRRAGFALNADRSYQVVIRLPGTRITPAGQRGRWSAQNSQLSMKLTVVGAGTSTWEILTARIIGVFDEGLSYSVEFVDDDTIQLGDQQYRRVTQASAGSAESQ
jgi:hypothetical protein